MRSNPPTNQGRFTDLRGPAHPKTRMWSTTMVLTSRYDAPKNGHGARCGPEQKRQQGKAAAASVFVANFALNRDAALGYARRGLGFDI